MMPNIPITAYPDTVAEFVAPRCRIWSEFLVEGRPWQKSGRTRWQDKSRDVRLGRSDRQAKSFSGLRPFSKRCATHARGASLAMSLTCLGSAPIVVIP